MPHDDGGKVFPEGMTLHDWFVGHASTEIPAWFKPQMPIKKPVYDDYAPFQRIHFKRDYEVWGDDYIRLRFIQWPFHYADLMIAEKRRREAQK